MNYFFSFIRTKLITTSMNLKLILNQIKYISNETCHEKNSLDSTDTTLVHGAWPLAHNIYVMKYTTGTHMIVVCSRISVDEAYAPLLAEYKQIDYLLSINKSITLSKHYQSITNSNSNEFQKKNLLILVTHTWL